VEASLNRVVDWDTAAEAIRTAFQEALNIVLEPGDLTRAERAEADELVAQKFGNHVWNRRI
jgi:lipoate-protein ligase A